MTECIYRPVYEMLVLNTYVSKLPLNINVDVSIRARCVNFGLSLYLHPNVEYVNSGGWSERSLLLSNWMLSKTSDTDSYIFMAYHIFECEWHF